MKVLFVGSEAKPFITTGGLAEALFGQARAAFEKGIEPYIMIPMYRQIKDHVKATFVCATTVYIGDSPKYVGILKTVVRDVTYFFIDNEEYFYRDNLYGYADDGERFSFFCEAVLESLQKLEIFPDVLHLHDWHTGLIPYILKAKYKYIDAYRSIKTVFTIDTFSYQGIFPKDMEQILDVPQSPILYLDDKINFMKAAIMEADIVTTVSPTYCKESLTKEYNPCLRQVLIDRGEDYQGILNGIDYEKFNPALDRNIAINYPIEDTIEGKKKNKEEFKNEHRFPETDCMLVGFVAYLTEQKGLELLTQAMEKLIHETDVQFFFLGAGEKKYEDFLNYLAAKYPDRFKCYIGYNPKLAHRIYASCDMLLQPYRYEASSNGQLISLHYGCIPLIHEVGGLKDIEQAYNEYTGEGNGFSFANENVDDFIKVFHLAYGLYRFNQKEWYHLIERSFNLDVSWNHSMDKYIEIYKKISR